jgi:transposase-like protein
MRYRLATIDTALILQAELKNFRTVGRLLGVNHQTVANWVHDFGGHISWILDNHTHPNDPFNQRVARLLEKA